MSQRSAKRLHAECSASSSFKLARISRDLLSLNINDTFTENLPWNAAMDWRMMKDSDYSDDNDKVSGEDSNRAEDESSSISSLLTLNTSFSSNNNNLLSVEDTVEKRIPTISLRRSSFSSLNKRRSSLTSPSSPDSQNASLSTFNDINCTSSSPPQQSLSSPPSSSSSFSFEHFDTALTNGDDVSKAIKAIELKRFVNEKLDAYPSVLLRNRDYEKRISPGCKDIILYSQIALKNAIFVGQQQKSPLFKSSSEPLSSSLPSSSSSSPSPSPLSLSSSSSSHIVRHESMIDELDEML